jgi:orotidine-5'-phosphate decarboxylase
VTPGVRPPGTKTDDQARSKTVAEAICEGASRVVVGRPVLRASNPEEVLDLILEGRG